MVSEGKLLPIHLRDFQSSVAVRIVQPVYCVVVFLFVRRFQLCFDVFLCVLLIFRYFAGLCRAFMQGLLARF